MPVNILLQNNFTFLSLHFLKKISYKNHECIFTVFHTIPRPSFTKRRCQRQMMSAAFFHSWKRNKSLRVKSRVLFWRIHSKARTVFLWTDEERPYQYRPCRRLDHKEIPWRTKFGRFQDNRWYSNEPPHERGDLISFATNESANFSINYGNLISFYLIFLVDVLTTECAPPGHKYVQDRNIRNPHLKRPALQVVNLSSISVLIC